MAMEPPAAPTRSGERPRWRDVLRDLLVDRERLADAALRLPTLLLRLSAHGPCGCGMSIGTALVGM